MTTSRKNNYNQLTHYGIFSQDKAVTTVRIKRKLNKIEKGGEANHNLTVINSGLKGKTEIHPIDRRLEELGQKRSWLARKTGISVGHIGAICRREARLIPGSAVQGKLCWALNVDLNQILGLKTTGQKTG